MGIRLGANRYGKDGIRLVTLRRLAERHEVRDLTVSVRLEGDFEAVHAAGDNASVLPTDTMRSTVYAFAREHAVAPIETFARVLGARFLEAAPTATLAQVHIAEHPWRRVASSAFTRSDGETRTATATVTADGVTVDAGVEGLLLLKSAGSAFSGFHKDRYTVLAETEDRILVTAMTATWAYADADADFDGCHRDVRRTLVDTFARHDSRSLQHTMYAMGQAALRACPPLARIAFTLSNRHHLAVDLAPYGQDDAGEVFVATDRPYGVIEGTIERDAPS